MLNIQHNYITHHIFNQPISKKYPLQNAFFTLIYIKAIFDTQKTKKILNTIKKMCINFESWH
ncbi:MAG: DUF1836 domain-containing protein [Clostridia bacterium]|nr:DUF1836 domain-containing protein [Clostridia bacterium]